MSHDTRLQSRPNQRTASMQSEEHHAAHEPYRYSRTPHELSQLRDALRPPGGWNLVDCFAWLLQRANWGDGHVTIKRGSKTERIRLQKHQQFFSLRAMQMAWHRRHGWVRMALDRMQQAGLLTYQVTSRKGVLVTITIDGMDRSQLQSSLLQLVDDQGIREYVRATWSLRLDPGNPLAVQQAIEAQQEYLEEQHRALEQIWTSATETRGQKDHHGKHRSTRQNVTKVLPNNAVGKHNQFMTPGIAQRKSPAISARETEPSTLGSTVPAREFQAPKRILQAESTNPEAANIETTPGKEVLPPSAEADEFRSSEAEWQSGEDIPDLVNTSPASLSPLAPPDSSAPSPSGTGHPVHALDTSWSTTSGGSTTQRPPALDERLLVQVEDSAFPNHTLATGDKWTLEGAVELLNRLPGFRRTNATNSNFSRWEMARANCPDLDQLFDRLSCHPQIQDLLHFFQTPGRTPLTFAQLLGTDGRAEMLQRVVEGEFLPPTRRRAQLPRPPRRTPSDSSGVPEGPHAAHPAGQPNIGHQPLTDDDVQPIALDVPVSPDNLDRLTRLVSCVDWLRRNFVLYDRRQLPVLHSLLGVISSITDLHRVRASGCIDHDGYMSSDGQDLASKRQLARIPSLVLAGRSGTGKNMLLSVLESLS